MKSSAMLIWSWPQSQATSPAELWNHEALQQLNDLTQLAEQKAQEVQEAAEEVCCIFFSGHTCS